MVLTYLPSPHPLPSTAAQHRLQPRRDLAKAARLAGSVTLVQCFSLDTRFFVCLLILCFYSCFDHRCGLSLQVDLSDQAGHDVCRRRDRPQKSVGRSFLSLSPHHLSSPPSADPSSFVSFASLCHSAAECISEHGKSVCASLGGTCVNERDGYYSVSLLCVSIGALLLVTYIIPTARRLQGMSHFISASFCTAWNEISEVLTWLRSSLRLIIEQLCRHQHGRSRFPRKTTLARRWSSF
jgi:hypothetical protein